MSDDSTKSSGGDFGKTLLGTGSGKRAAPEIEPVAVGQQPGAAITGETMLGTGSHAGTPATGAAATDEPISIAPTMASSPGEAAGTIPGSATARGGDDRDLIGRELGGYRILEKIDEGGMGVVFLGEHVQISRRAAIKLLKLEHCRNEKTVERFYQEARAVNSIGHPNIVDIFDFGRDDDGRVFFVMELLEGEPLSHRIRRGPIPWREAAPLIRQVLAALQAAHATDIVHRDLKPENIFLRRGSDGGVSSRLLDFGIAKFLDLENMEDKLTRTGSLIGTPQYMSPEQINGAADIDGRTDIYSLGVILFEMFTGRRPFEGETLGQVIRGHLLTAPPALIIPDASGVPGGVADIVGRMLAKKAGDRYSTIAEVTSDIKDVTDHRPPTHASTLNRTRPIIDESEAAIPPAPTRSPWPAALAIGGALAAVIAVLAFLLIGRGDGAKTTAGDTPATEGSSSEAPADPAEPSVDPEAARGAAQKVLAGSLNEAEPQLRVQGTDGYATLRDRDAIEPLSGLLGGDPDGEVRGHAARALGMIGDEMVAPKLVAVAKEAEMPLRTWIDEALARLGDDGARKRLAAAARSKELAVAAKATFALADVSPGGDKEAVRALTRLARREAELADISPYAGIQILTRLARHRHGKARELLYAALEEPDEGTRLAAANALARLGDDTGKEALQKILDDEASPNRLAAARALASLGDYTGFDLMTSGLENEEAAVRTEAATGLGEVGEEKSLAPLLEATKGGDKSVQIAAAIAVLRIVGLNVRLLAQASVDWTKSALQSDDWAVRAAGAGTLADLPRAQSLPLLATAIADPEPRVRREAALSAGKIKGKEAGQRVARAAETETNKEVKESQVVALAAIKEPETKSVVAAIAQETGRLGVLASGALIALGETEAIARLDEAVRDRSTGIRIAAVESAGLAQDPVVVGTLSTAAGDRTFEVRLAAAEVLSEYRASEDVAVPILEEALGKRNPEMAARAQAALLRFGKVLEGQGPAELLASDKPEVRLAAIEAIEAMPWTEAESLLRRGLSDEDARVRRRSMEAVEKFETGSAEGVIRLYKSLVDDRDEMVRAKAQARLARLIEDDKKTTAAKAPVDDARTIAELRGASERVAAIRTSFDEAAAELEKLAEQVDQKTRRPAKDEDEVEEVERLIERIEKSLARAKKIRGEFRAEVSKAEILGAGLTGDEGKKLIAEVEAVAVEVGTRIGDAIRAADRAAGKAEKYAKDETADAGLYLTSAQTALATGNLSAARRDLRKAEQLFRSQGKAPADLHFAYGELHAKLARGASSDADKRKNLQRAIASFKRFAAAGRGFKVERAREQIARLEADLAKLP